MSLCHRKNNIMSKLLADSGPFLFPCTIEYSLICAAVLYVMWKNIAEEHEHYKFQKRRRKISAAMAVNRLVVNDTIALMQPGDLNDRTFFSLQKGTFAPTGAAPTWLRTGASRSVPPTTTPWTAPTPTLGSSPASSSWSSPSSPSSSSSC